MNTLLIKERKKHPLKVAILEKLIEIFKWKICSVIF
jgi:hypothetical protein